jgi:hypothetical protein
MVRKSRTNIFTRKYNYTKKKPLATELPRANFYGINNPE